jgi:hypothetical protein
MQRSVLARGVATGQDGELEPEVPARLRGRLPAARLRLDLQALHGHRESKILESLSGLQGVRLRREARVV